MKKQATSDIIGLGKSTTLKTLGGYNMTINFTYLWLALAVALTVLEINTTRLVCLWFILGSVAALIISLFTKSLFVQLFTFAVASGAALLITRPLAEKLIRKKPVPTNFDMIIGKVAILTEGITPATKGRVKIDGISWLATADEAMPKGVQVRVVSVSGNTLHVETVK